MNKTSILQPHRDVMIREKHTMNEPRDDFTDEPPRREDGIVGQSPASAHGYANPVDVAGTPQQSRKNWLLYVVGACLGIALLAALMIGLVITGLAKARHAAERSQSAHNLKQMTLALNNVATNTVSGNIPPAYGQFPIGSDRSASFFEHLLPYIEQAGLYGRRNPEDSVKTYIAPVDPRNHGMDGTISYGSNATVLTGQPRFPNSFGGRSATIICIMERSGLDGAHKWSNQSNYLGAPGTPPPFPQIGVDPSAYLDGSPQGFVSAGCLVGLADGSVRLVTKTQTNGWNWACDPALTGPQPSNW
jgi:hypothetical protein